MQGIEVILTAKLGFRVYINIHDPLSICFIYSLWLFLLPWYSVRSRQGVLSLLLLSLLRAVGAVLLLLLNSAEL